MFLKLAALLLLVPVCSFVPGFLVVRRARLPDELRLSISVTVSLALLYATGFALYLLGAGAAPYGAIAAAVVVAAALFRKELYAFLRSPSVSPILVHQALFASWLLLLSLAVRSFSGGGWMGDWEEHYERAVFFLGGLPIDTRFIVLWSLTARPPLNNLVAAFFLKVAGTDFAAYQLTMVLLASLEILGAASLLFALSRASAARRWTGLLVLTLLLGLNPSVIQNATYPWTRALTNLFLLEAAALYLFAIREGSPAARRWSYLHLGLALTTHYSAVPYLIGLALVELRFLVTRRFAPGEAALSAAIAAVPIAPWLAFALVRFGAAGTFLSNSTVVWNAALGRAGILSRALGNLGATLVPHPFRSVPPFYVQEYVWGTARDFAFLVYQVSLPALMGSVGGLAVAWLIAKGAVRRLRAGRFETPALGAAFLVTVVVLGIASVADDDSFGVAHVCLQPLGVGGLVYLASRWRDAPRWLRAGMGAGLLVDAAVGIGLHFWLQHLAPDDLNALNPDHAAVSPSLVDNLLVKLDRGLVFLGDLEGRFVAIGALAVTLVALVTLAAVCAKAELRRPDTSG